MTETQTAPRPLTERFVLDEIEARTVQQLSPSFVRVEFQGECLAEFGTDGPLYDQRIKLIFPNDRGVLPSFAGADESWFQTWLDLPASERGPMRTYTVRELRGEGRDTRLVVDFVRHEDDGTTGPGASWAASARPGDRLVLLGPRRGVPFGGIEFAPATTSDLLLVADETAVPAVAAILEQLPAGATGRALLEVPVAADAQALAAPPGVDVSWLPRDGGERGEQLFAQVVEHLGDRAEPPEVADDEVDPQLWETPTYSSATGEVVAPGGTRSVGPWGDLYAWIAGESKVVTGLRRHLVKEQGVDRRQVCFMGYWRRGVAMRS